MARTKQTARVKRVATTQRPSSKLSPSSSFDFEDNANQSTLPSGPSQILEAQPDRDIHKKQFQNRDITGDITFLIGSNAIPVKAHRKVLSHCLHGEKLMWEKGEEIVIPQHRLTVASFMAFLEYIYLGKTTVTVDNVFGLLFLTYSEFKFSELCDLCQDFLQQCMTPEWCLAYLQEADLWYRCGAWERDETNQALKLLRKNPLIAMSHPKFKDTSRWLMRKIVKSDVLRMKEIDLCEKLYEWWIENTTEKNKRLFRHIRFDCISYKDLVCQVGPKRIASRKSFMAALYSAGHYGREANHRKWKFSSDDEEMYEDREESDQSIEGWGYSPWDSSDMTPSSRTSNEDFQSRWDNSGDEAATRSSDEEMPIETEEFDIRMPSSAYPEVKEFEAPQPKIKTPKVKEIPIDITNLAKLLKDSPTYLNLQAKSIGNENLRPFCKELKSNSSLTSLQLDRNGLTKNGAKHIAKALKENKTLTKLHLGDNRIKLVGARSLFKALKSNTTLTSLHISQNDIGIDGAQAVGEALKENKSLTCLGFANNNIRDEGVEALAEALKTNSTLTTLIIWQNNFGNDGAEALGEALKKNKTLTHLDASVNKIGDSGATSLSRGLKKNNTLTHLDLQYNNISDKGASKISKIMSVNQSLSSLNLFGNKLNSKTPIQNLGLQQPPATESKKRPRS